MPPTQSLERVRDILLGQVFQRRFSGMNWDESKAIQRYLVRAIANNYPRERVINYIMRKHPDTTEGEAERIWRIENHELRNKIREIAFRSTDPEGEARYAWLSVPDNRRTNICERITERTRKGVSLEELKQVIQEEVRAAKARGELPNDYSAREWTPHFGCRSVTNRLFE